MTALRCLLVFTLLTLGTTAALGQCVVRKRAVVVNQAATVATAVVAPVVTPIVSTIPAYGAVYDASAQEVPQLKEQLAVHQSRIAILESARDNLLARVAVLESKLGISQPAPKAEAPKPEVSKPAPQPAVAKGNLPALFARSCIQCHQAGKNPKGGLALVDATGKSLVAIGCEERLETLRRINLPETDAHVMPPKGKGVAATDEEAAEVLSVLTETLPKK